MLVGGIYAFEALGKREDSTFVIKSAIVICPYSGATPEEVENMVSVIGTRQNISLTTLREDMKKKWSIGSTKAKEYIDRASQLGILTVSDNKYTANPVERFDNDNYKMPF
jgi:multidrug efflux pump subunit AcrB